MRLSEDKLPAGFEFIENRLFCEGCSVEKLADKYGTPLYIYSRNHFLERLKEFKQALAGRDHMICFAVKSNSNLGILNCLASHGCGFDIVSGGELQRVIKAGADTDRVVYAGVGKTAAEQKMALQAGIHMFNVESWPEILQLNQQAGQLDKIAPIALRVNPDVDAKTHAKITTGKKENKFGIPATELVKYAEKIHSLANLRLKGLHFHIGSQITSIDPFVELGQKVRSSVTGLRKQGFEIGTVNLGGGLGIDYTDEKTISPARWADAVFPAIDDLDLKIIIEPGRYLVGNSGILVTSVLYLKEAVTKKFVIVDAGMNTLIRPAMYDAYHEIGNAVKQDRQLIEADIVGPVCETGDSFGSERVIERPEAGEYLAIYSSGAYGFPMASHYNSIPRPAELLVDNDSVCLIRERETYEDLWRGEKIYSG
ncbi:MAG: diaminopimelate decarboxylase [bacterium]